MAKAKRSREHWKDEPEEHDFPAAADYLSLSFSESASASIVQALRGATTTHRKAKDLLRAAGLELLPVGDPEVANDLKKIVRGVPLVVADGYHRICASYHLAADAEVACRVVDAP